MPLRRLTNRIRLPRSPSLNPTLLADFPGLPDSLGGTQARDWLATSSIARSMAASSEVMAALTERSLRVTPLPDVDGVSAYLMEAAASWPPALDALMVAGDARALLVADGLGDALGVLVATLALGPVDARQARPDWSQLYWDRWARVRSLAIGGGVVQGRLGEHLVNRTALQLRQIGVGVTITRAAYPAGLGVLGAASLLGGTGVALDCGGTTIKRATVAHHLSGPVLTSLPSLSAPGRVGAQQVIDVIADAIAGAAEPVRERPVEVVLAIATYVDGSGQPYADQLGPYAPLGEVDFGAGLHDATRRRGLGLASLTVIHDGAAALLGARVDHPDVDAAIVLGTAIGCSLTPDIASGPGGRGGFSPPMGLTPSTIRTCG